jgi:hypothetical protein
MLTQLLDAVAQADDSARGRLFELVYGELREMAAREMARERPGRTLQPTALVHEAYLRLFAAGDNHFDNRRHFFAAAANAMRRILVDDARKRERKKRGGRIVENRGQGTEESRGQGVEGAGGSKSRGAGEQGSGRERQPHPQSDALSGRLPPPGKGRGSGDQGTGDSGREQARRS